VADHIPGAINDYADYLSRDLSLQEDKEIEDISKDETILKEQKRKTILRETLKNSMIQLHSTPLQQKLKLVRSLL
jgi:hypothetical protein